MAWQTPGDSITAKENALWVIYAPLNSLESRTVRYGLSLLAISVQKIKGIGFPILIVTDDDSLMPEHLPTPFRGSEVILLSDKTLGAKFTARANTPVPKIATEYRIDIHANQGYGIWFETGPAKGEEWKGVLAGGLISDVNAHGVGTSGLLPLKTVLEYQMQGIKLSFGKNEFSAWAVKNIIDDQHSYYFRFNDIPDQILFGQLPDEQDDGLLYHIELC
ncbi:hypothetical protein [Desulfamplus magnetovallimortis]|nr:hypothetical protein [Desulfamplus magnetovallimortis]